MELTLTTELMSGITGTRTVGAMRSTRRVVAPEAVARSTMMRLAPRALRGISWVRTSWGAGSGAEGFRVHRQGLDGRIAAGSGRVEGPEDTGALIAGAKKERQQAESRCIHQQHTLAAS